MIETLLRTSEKPERLELTLDPARDEGLLQVDCLLKDAFGQPWVHGNPEIQVEVEGPGQLIGLDNGDFMRDSEPSGNRCGMKDGHLTAYIRRKGSGPIRVTASDADGHRSELMI